MLKIKHRKTYDYCAIEKRLNLRSVEKAWIVLLMQFYTSYNAGISPNLNDVSEENSLGRKQQSRLFTSQSIS